MLSTYAGTKAFLSSFSGSLAEEVRSKGIDVQCVNTYFVVRICRLALLSRTRSSGRIHPGLQHVENPPRERAHTPAKGLRPQCPLENHPPSGRPLDEPPWRRYPVLEPRLARLRHGASSPGLSWRSLFGRRLIWSGCALPRTDCRTSLGGIWPSSDTRTRSTRTSAVARCANASAKPNSSERRSRHPQDSSMPTPSRVTGA